MSHAPVTTAKGNSSFQLHVHYVVVMACFRQCKCSARTVSASFHKGRSQFRSERGTFPPQIPMFPHILVGASSFGSQVNQCERGVDSLEPRQHGL
jgi:hypothetical protein